jgi:hypothetical protein
MRARPSWDRTLVSRPPLTPLPLSPLSGREGSGVHGSSSQGADETGYGGAAGGRRQMPEVVGSSTARPMSRRMTRPGHSIR